MPTDEQPRKEIDQPSARTTEEELRERYEEQLQRLACPSCGEEPFSG